MSHAKRRGEWAELQFMAKAAKLGLQVSKPWGELSRYDMVIGTAGHFVSVQIKSTIMPQPGRRLHMRCQTQHYGQALPTRRIRFSGSLCHHGGRLVHHPGKAHYRPEDVRDSSLSLQAEQQVRTLQRGLASAALSLREWQRGRCQPRPFVPRSSPSSVPWRLLQEQLSIYNN